MDLVVRLVYMLIFPGFLFLVFYGMACDWVDRKLYARFQNRVGPPWFQPLADFIKLLSKEEIIPEAANQNMFRVLPVVALAAALTSFLYIPVWDLTAFYSFPADLVVVFYLLTIPTLAFFLAGWNSTSLFAALGSLRTLIQLFAYEVPLLIVLMGPALLAGTWTISEISAFFVQNPSLLGVNVIGLVVALVAIQGKLERRPFDIADAETEVVGGTFTEFSGRLLAIIHLVVNIEMVVLASLISAIFLGGSFGLGPIWGFILYLFKTLFIVTLLTLLKTLVARLRLEQMMKFCWKYLAPAALFQLLINIVVKAFLV
ncbi:MAG: NADH-quinone oxidoreductase subunit H [Firmicutes bacterium]|nr:NADH-quinone oxidoreductase subunit H [Bacillota bacterium]